MVLSICIFFSFSFPTFPLFSFLLQIPSLGSMDIFSPPPTKSKYSWSVRDTVRECIVRTFLPVIPVAFYLVLLRIFTLLLSVFPLVFSLPFLSALSCPPPPPPMTSADRYRVFSLAMGWGGGGIMPSIHTVYHTCSVSRKIKIVPELASLAGRPYSTNNNSSEN